MSQRPVRFLASLLSVAVGLSMGACGGGGDSTGPSDDDEPRPSVNLGTVDLRLQEDSTKTVDLSGVVSNGSLSSVSVTSGPVTTTLSGTSLQLTPEPDQNGTYRLEFTATGSGGTTTRSKDGRIEPLVDIPSGQLQDNETDTGQQGELRVYAAEDSSLLVQVETDAQGNYPKQENVSGGDVIVQAALTDDGGNLSSYVRTLRAEDGADLADTVIRAVPFTGLAGEGISVEDFRGHVLDLRRHMNHEITKWDTTSFKGVYIIETNPEADDHSRFTREQQEITKEKWEDPTDIPRLIEGHIPDTVIIGEDEDESPPYTLDENGKVQPDTGWVAVKPDSTMPAAGAADPDDLDNDGTYETGEIGILPSIPTTSLFQTIAAHEAVHMFYNWIHPETLDNDETIAHANPAVMKPQLADEKSGHIYQEETYRLGETVLDILALDWLDGQ